MTRAETTKFLGDLLITRFKDRTYWAREVSIDYGTSRVKRGLNFLGEKNYIVTTMQCYKDIQPDVRSGKLWKHIQECNPESLGQYGIMVPVPYGRELTDEYENSTELTADKEWELKEIMPCHQKGRKRSTTELLFCMLRSGK